MPELEELYLAGVEYYDDDIHYGKDVKLNNSGEVMWLVGYVEKDHTLWIATFDGDDMAHLIEDTGVNTDDLMRSCNYGERDPEVDKRWDAIKKRARALLDYEAWEELRAAALTTPAYSWWCFGL